MGTYREAVQLADYIYNRYYFGTGNSDILKALYPQHYLELISGIPDSRRVDNNFIFGIIRRESLFGLDAYSSAGAIGLMQLMPATAKSLARSLGISDLKDHLKVMKDKLYNSLNRTYSFLQ
ncbi:transglycosylase SLT domain-containing protein [candidate division KSB1 bacterium]